MAWHVSALLSEIEDLRNRLSVHDPTILPLFPPLPETMRAAYGVAGANAALPRSRGNRAVNRTGNRAANGPNGSTANGGAAGNGVNAATRGDNVAGHGNNVAGVREDATNDLGVGGIKLPIV